MLFQVVVPGSEVGVMKAPVLGARPYGNALAIIHTQQSNTFDMLNSLTTSVVSIHSNKPVFVLKLIPQRYFQNSESIDLKALLHMWSSNKAEM